MKKIMLRNVLQQHDSISGEHITHSPNYVLQRNATANQQLISIFTLLSSVNEIYVYRF
jgi:hypothetical protein